MRIDGDFILKLVFEIRNNFQRHVLLYNQHTLNGIYYLVNTMASYVMTNHTKKSHLNTKRISFNHIKSMILGVTVTPTLNNLLIIIIKIMFILSIGTSAH